VMILINLLRNLLSQLSKISIKKTGCKESLKVEIKKPNRAAWDALLIQGIKE
jgi:hypothetical protein